MTTLSSRSGSALSLLLAATLGAGCTAHFANGQNAPCEDDASLCDPGFVCVQGICRRACEVDDGCCADDGGTCDVAAPPCGNLNEACCDGYACGAGLGCAGTVCLPCGRRDEPCCDNSVEHCQAGLTCSTGPDGVDRCS